MVFQVGALFIALPVGLVFAGSVLFGDHSLKTILIAGGLLGFVAWAFIPRSRKKADRYPGLPRGYLQLPPCRCKAKC